MPMVAQFEGPWDVEFCGSAVAHIRVDSEHAWLFVEQIGGVIQLRSGPACENCERGSGTLKRCQRHPGVLFIAKQLWVVG